MAKQTGRVLRVDAKVVHVDLDGTTVQASPRGTLFEGKSEQKNPIAVGDFVEVGLEGDPIPVERVLERRNYLGRIASAHDPREQVLVANVDRLFLIGSLSKPGFSSNRTDRILAACVWHEIEATLVLNKIDLADEGEVDAITETYRSIPIEVLHTCALTGEGLDTLAARMKDQVSVFYGPSGAGKSTPAESHPTGPQHQGRSHQQVLEPRQAHHQLQLLAPPGNGWVHHRHPRHPRLSAVRRERRGNARPVPRLCPLPVGLPLSELHPRPRTGVRGGRCGRRRGDWLLRATPATSTCWTRRSPT